jgi:phospholipid/cholesterol/gamma-HCH transport system substrate-binding protein
LGASLFALLLSGGAFSDTYTVTARFADAAGIRSGDDVTVAGLDAGSVGGVRIANGSVEVDLKIDSDVAMPSDSRAEIVVETLLGKQAVELIAGDSPVPLRDGGHIALDRTTTPVDVSDLSDASVALLDRSDAQALERLMQEVTKITHGKRRQVGALIRGLGDVSSALDTKRDELARLLESMNTLATTFGSNDDTIVSIVDRYNHVLGNLARRRDDLRLLLQSTDDASHAVAALVDRNRPMLDSTLRNLHESLGVVDDHQLDLAASLSYLETAVEGYSSIGYAQGVPVRWGNIFVQSVGPVGVDALVGRCGLLDQALDEILGPDPRSCEDRSDFGEERGGASAPLPLPVSESPQAPSPRSAEGGNPIGAIVDDVTESLPGSIGDLIEGVLGGLP